MSRMIALGAGLIALTSLASIASADITVGDKKTKIVRTYCELCSITVDDKGNRERHCNVVPCPSASAARFAPNVPIGSECVIRRSGMPDRNGRVTAARTCGTRISPNQAPPVAPKAATR